MNSNEIFPPNFNNAFRAILAHTGNEYCFLGGRGSCKSSFVSVVIICLILSDPNYNALVLRKVAHTLRDSVYEQLLWAIDILGLTDEFRAAKSPLCITYLRTGQKILFRGADEPKKIKSIKLKQGYFAVTWFEELTEFTPEDVETIKLSTMRGGDEFFIFYSFNPPSSARNWCNREFKKSRKNLLVHKSDYRTVPRKWLGVAFWEEANSLKKRNRRAYDNIFLGKVTGTGTNIFENIELRKIADDEIRAFEYFYYGIDWGFYPDPFMYVQMAYDAPKATLYIFDELKLYKHGNHQASEKLKEHLTDWYGLNADGICEHDFMGDRITADSSEPKSVADFRLFGWDCRKAIKGAGSIEAGFKWLQSLAAIVIDPVRAPNAADEFTLYEYEIDKRTGEVLEGYPQGQPDHAMAAVRYAMEGTWRRAGE